MVNRKTRLRPTKLFLYVNHTQGEKLYFKWWPIAAIEKKLSKSRKNFQNQEKNFGIHKNISEPKKKKKKEMKSRKKLRKKKFKIKKNISESRKLFQNREIICYKN